MSKRKQQRITAIKINMYQLYLTASKNKQNLTEKKKLIMEIKVQKEFINENRESQVIVIILIFFFLL